MSPSVIHRFWTAFLRRELICRKNSHGRTVATNSAYDLYLQPTERSHRTTTLTHFRSFLVAAIEKLIFKSTERRMLHEEWLYARRPAVSVHLMRRHRN
ncbi:hypothetical protein AVEN_180014-1 [Araneus ventricosus]|uniref:Uncharacterized protein n=1 Tax=Araneus ventricosus TaxID=182803 RepID=A0A4Y2GW55_ARAVE|nr:hypothetical protein AVEN_180014-1 [Araneus ventricosus]